MTNNELYLELVTELTKKTAQPKIISQLCKQLSIPFDGDIVELMTYMLGSGIMTKKIKTTKKNKKTNYDYSFE